MGRDSQKVEASPPEIVERTVHLLIPPAVREEVAGDLCERYRSQRQYIMEVTSMLPHIIASQIRRNTNVPLLGVQALLLFFCFGGFVTSADAAALDVPRWLRAALPTLIALSALLLRDAYRENAEHPAWRAAFDVLIVFLSVVVSQILLAALNIAEILNENWILSPRRAIVAGAGLPMLYCLRLAANYRLPSIGDEMSREDLGRDFQRFERNIRWRNRAIAIGGITAVSTAGPGLFLQAAGLPAQIGWAVAFAGGLLVAGYIFFKSSVKPMPAEMGFTSSLAFYRGELERQSKILRSVWWWYLLSIVPAIVGAAIGAGSDNTQLMLGSLQPVQIAGYIFICVLVGWLYAQYAHCFQTRFKNLAAIRERTPT